MALSADTPRVYGVLNAAPTNELGVKASTTIFEGAAVEVEIATGYARPCAGDDTAGHFAGFAHRKAVATAADSAGQVTVMLIEKGDILLPAVTGVNSNDDYQKPVFASDDGTFSLTDSGNDHQIGVVKRFSAEGVLVSFKANGIA